MALVIVIISNYNGISVLHKTQPILKLCLDSLKDTIYQDYKLLLADDCSIDKSIEYVKSNYPYVNIVQTKEKSGFSKNNNNAIKYSIKKFDPSYILLLNNDIIITNKNWLTELVESARFHKEVGIVGPKLVYPDGKIQHAGIIIGIAPRNRGRAESDIGQYDKIEEVEALTGAAFLINKKTINKIGLLDENYYMGFEDIDYCVRARNAGFKLLFNGRVSLIHLEGFSSTNSLDKKDRDLRFYLNQTGYVFFALYHFNFIQLVTALIMEILGGIFTIEDRNRIRRLASLRLKDRPLWRLAVSLRAIIKGYTLYKDSRITGLSNA